MPPIFAQEEDEPEDLEDYESDQDIEDAQDAGKISDELASQLNDLYDNPININEADETELGSLPGIEFDDAKKIVQERITRGPYEKLEDLVQRGAITAADFAKIRLLITVEKSVVLKTKGELRHDTVAQIEPSLKRRTLEDESTIVLRTSAELQRAVHSPTVDKSRFKITNIADRLRIGGSFLGDTFNVLENAPMVDANRATFKEIRQYRWIKGYMGYDAKPSKKKEGLFKSDFLQQVYLGHYRLGFYEGTEKEKSLGFLADNRTTAPGKAISNTPQQRLSAPLRGIGVRLGSKKLSYSGFYSRDSYPAELRTETFNSATLKSQTANSSIQDILDMEMFGGYIGYSSRTDSYLSGFWARQNADLNYSNFSQRILRSNMWGLGYRSSYKGVNYRTVFARLNEPVPGRPNDRNFYFGRVNAKSGKGTTITVSYKRIEIGFISPVAQIFAGNFHWRFNSRVNQKVGKILNLRLDYTQDEKVSGGLSAPGKSLGGQLRWKSGKSTNLFFSQSYSESASGSRTLNPDGTVKSAKISTSDKLTSRGRITYKSSQKVENRLTLDLDSSKRQDPINFKVGQEIAYRLIYKIVSDTQIRGEFIYADTNIYIPGTESQTFRLEIRTKPSKNMELRFRWDSKFQQGGETVLQDGILTDIDNPGDQNKVTVRAIYKW